MNKELEAQVSTKQKDSLDLCPVIIDKNTLLKYYLFRFKSDVLETEFLKSKFTEAKKELLDKFTESPNLSAYGTVYYSGVPTVIWVKCYSIVYKVPIYSARVSFEAFASTFYEQDIDLRIVSKSNKGN